MIGFLAMTLILVEIALQVNLAASIHEIDVVNSSSVCQTGRDCMTLVECLQNTTNCFASDTKVNFIDKLYEIQGTLSDYDSFYIVNDVSHLILAGNHSTIQCINKSMALAFIDIVDLQILRLQFVGCGGKMPGNVQYQLHLTGSDNTAFFMDTGTWVALLFGNINHLVLQQAEVLHSRGYGALIVDSIWVTILSSNFSRNNYQVLKCYRDGIIDVSCCLKFPWHNYTQGNCNGGNVVIINTDRAINPINTRTLIMDTLITEGVNLDTQRYFNENYTHTVGGLSIFSDHSSYSETVLISHCTIARNIGHNGGNMVLYIHDNVHFDYRVSIQSSMFINGNAGFRPFETTAQAGGLLIKFGYVNERSSTHNGQVVRKRVSILDSVFTGNYAFTAAAILFHSYIFHDKYMLIDVSLNNCTITENFGYDSIFTVRGNEGNRFNDIELTMTDVQLINNRLLHQVSLVDPLLAFSHSPHISTFHGEGFKSTTCVRIVVALNEMRGISTKLVRDFRFQGVNTISGNRGVAGGGIHIDRSRIRLQFHGARINLINNTATLTGGAIHVVPRILLISTPPSCFFNIEIQQCNSYILSSFQGSVFLRNNSAGISGNSIYGGNVRICQLVECPLFASSIFDRLFDLPWNASLTEVTSDVNGICFCISNRPACDLQVWPVSTYPGGRVLVPAVAVGQLNGTNPAIVLSNITDSNLVRLAEQEERQQVGVTCQDIVYNIYSAENAQFEIGLSVITNGILLETVQTVLVNTTHCPKGFELQESLKCTCIPLFSSLDITCFPDTEMFEAPSQVWVGYNAERNGFLGHRNCPFRKCGRKLSLFTLNSTSSLCDRGFSGILCGSCAETLSSTLGRVTCRRCSSAYSILIVTIFLFAGPLLVAAMLYGDLTANSGTLNGVIIYANVVHTYRTIFFGPDHISVVTVIIAWLNLDLGIDLCFYSGMTFYAQLWFQFLFPTYILFLSAVLICLNWYTSLGGKIIGNNIQNVTASLMLLSYTKLLRLVAEALSFTSLSSSSSDSYTVWLYDGNIPYMKAKHAVLSVAAVVTIIIFLAPFTLLLLFEYPLLKMKTHRVMVRLRLNTLTNIIQKPYKKSARWWTGMMLLFRVVVVILFQANIVGNQKLSLMFILTICLCILGAVWNLGSIYYNRFATMSESLYITNLVLLAGWSEYVSSPHDQRILSYTLVTPALLAFFITVLYHVTSKVVLLVREKRAKNRNGALQQCQNEYVEDIVCPDINTAHCTYIRVSEDLKPLTEILNDN